MAAQADGVQEGESANDDNNEADNEVANDVDNADEMNVDSDKEHDDAADVQGFVGRCRRRILRRQRVETA